VLLLRYKYLVIGGGMTAAAAVLAIRSIDPDGSIGLISAELVPPYDRPPLSKGLWTGKTFDSIWRKTENLNVDLHLGRSIQSLDPEKKRVKDDQDQSYSFDKLLLATGGTPQQFRFGGDDIIYFRTLQDYERLRALCEKGNRFAVIGGGFIGSEIAAALSISGKQVIMIFPGVGIGSNIFPEDLALFLNDYYRKKGVEIWAQESVTGLEMNDTFPTIITESRHEFPVDGIIAGIGTQPNTELADMAGLKVDHGIIVDEFLRTSHPDIYAAGDAASFYNPALGKRMCVEHEDNANTMGMFAGRNMAGESARYDYLPFFYSDLFELGYEAVGELDSRLEMVSDWKEPYEEGVVYYLKDKRICGVLLWNVWGQAEAARQLIAQPGPFEAEDLKGKLLLSSQVLHQLA
jgi:NADPH-dependent 2,4-dienoyl-CoA reductase/sulfur reductase-like enzyme